VSVQLVPIHEFNPCHNPSGPGGGRFCGELQVGVDYEVTDYGPQGEADVHLLVDGKRVGTIQLVHADGLSSPPEYLYVASASVDEPYRGKGHGQQLYQAAAAFAKTKGFLGIASEHSMRSPAARRAWDGLKRKRYVYRDTVYDILPA